MPLKAFGFQYAAAAIVAFLFASTAPVAIILSVGPALWYLSFREVIGALLAAGVLMLLLGLLFAITPIMPSRSWAL